MAIELRWLASQSASCFHAVTAIQQGLPLTDERFADALAEPTRELLNELDNVALPIPRVLRHLVALSPGIHNNRELTQVALKKVLAASQVGESLVTKISNRVGEIERAADRIYPKMVEDLLLRTGPLREQWESRGPGLLRSMAQRTDERLLVPNADVVVVHPVLSGAGAAHHLYNSIRIEGVLVNPRPELPEIVRMAWLLGQLNTDLPMFGENILADRLPFVAALALIPPTLNAGEAVELTRFDRATLELALSSWHVDSLALSPTKDPQAKTKFKEEGTDILLDWWDTYCDAKPRWDVALQALDKMLGEY